MASGLRHSNPGHVSWELEPPWAPGRPKQSSPWLPGVGASGFLGIWGAWESCHPCYCPGPLGTGGALATRSTLVFGTMIPWQVPASGNEGDPGQSTVTLAQGHVCPGPQVDGGCPGNWAPWPPVCNRSFPHLAWDSRGPWKRGWARAEGKSPAEGDARSHPPPPRFYVNLLCGEEPGSEAALHFNPRLDESSVVFNSLEHGAWGREERGPGIPFQRGQPFDVLLITTDEGFKVGLRRGVGASAQGSSPRPRREHRRGRGWSGVLPWRKRTSVAVAQTGEPEPSARGVGVPVQRRGPEVPPTPTLFPVRWGPRQRLRGRGVGGWGDRPQKPVPAGRGRCSPSATQAVPHFQPFAFGSEAEMRAL